MELGRSRHERKSHNLPSLKHGEANIMNHRTDTKAKTKSTYNKIDVYNTGRVTQRPHRKNYSDVPHQLTRHRDYDRMSIGSPIPAILPEDDDPDDKGVATSSPFPAIKVSSCSELRSTLTAASSEELLSPADTGTASGGLLSLSSPLYRKSTNGRYLQHFTSGDLSTSRSEGDIRTTSVKCPGRSSNSGHFDDLTRSHDLVSCQLLKLDIGTGRSKGQSGPPGRKPPQRLVPIRYSATAVNAPP